MIFAIQTWRRVNRRQRIRFSLPRTERIITWKTFLRSCTKIEGYIYELAELFESLFLRWSFSWNDLTSGEVGSNYSKFPCIFPLISFCSTEKKENWKKNAFQTFRKSNRGSEAMLQGIGKYNNKQCFMQWKKHLNQYISVEEE